MKTLSVLFLSFITSVITAAPVNGPRDAFGPYLNGEQSHPPLPGPRPGIDVVHRWNQIAIDATGLDHTPVGPGENRTFGEQLGPGRASRAMAIVHIAIFDSIDAILGGYQSYTGIDSAPHPVSIRAAAAQAAHDTLVSLYPSQKATFDQELADDLLRVTSDTQKGNGVAFGKQIAAAILASRVGDGAEIPELHIGIDYST